MYARAARVGEHRIDISRKEAHRSADAKVVPMPPTPDAGSNARKIEIQVEEERVRRLAERQMKDTSEEVLFRRIMLSDAHIEMGVVDRLLKGRCFR